MGVCEAVLSAENGPRPFFCAKIYLRPGSGYAAMDHIVKTNARDKRTSSADGGKRIPPKKLFDFPQNLRTQSFLSKVL